MRAVSTRKANEKRLIKRDKNYNDIKNSDQNIRRYHLTNEEKINIIEEAKALGRVANPLKGRIGAYWGSVEALIELGADEWHSLKKVALKMQEIMSGIEKFKKSGGKTVQTNAWDEFYNKTKRDGASRPKDGLGRIEQNFKVLQRLPRAGKFEKNPYGLKLAQFGMCIDIQYRELGENIHVPYFRLRTGGPFDDDGIQTRPLLENPTSSRKKRSQKEKAE